MSKKPLEIDMIAGSQIRDTQGEMLSVEGADISELQSGNGRLNDNHGKGFFNSIGRVTGAKKIMKSEDCDGERQKYYWEKVKAPFIYVTGVLYDDDDHPNAKAAAAILRNIHRADTPLKLKASVEGGVVARGIADSNLLARTKIHSVALTFTPANNATLVEPLSLDKSHTWTEDAILIKSVLHLAKTNVPSFRHIARQASAEKIVSNFDKIRGIAEAAGLKTQLPHYSADGLIREAVLYKIKGNVEKINGLIKAIPGREAHSYNFGSTQDDGTKISGYTGEDAKKAQIRAVKTISSDPQTSIVKPYKTMENLQTGKPELHVLIHHGVNKSTGDSTGTQGHKQAADREHNMFSVNNGIVDHPTYGVHTWDHGAANEYTDKSKQSGVHSFWVPVSSIHATRNYENARFKNPNQELPKDFGEAKDQAPDDNLIRWQNSSASEDRKTIQYDPQAEEEGHISIGPGKFHQASKQDLQDQHDKIEAYRKKHANTRDPEISKILGSLSSPLENKTVTHTRDGRVVGDQAKSSIKTRHEKLQREAGNKQLEIQDDSFSNHLEDLGVKRHTAMNWEKDGKKLSPEESSALENEAWGRHKAGTHPKTLERYKLSKAIPTDMTGGPLYHIHSEGTRVTTDGPLSLRQIKNLYGGVKKLEASGHVLVPHEEVEKALMAGYGGAGAPGANTGGSVLQSESLDDGRDGGIKYINCNQCGKGQVYMKHQVKCRECNQHFPMSDLYKFMVQGK